MSRYLVLLYAPEDEEPIMRQRWAQLPAWLELTESLREAGLLVANGALHRTRLKSARSLSRVTSRQMARDDQLR